MVQACVKKAEIAEVEEEIIYRKLMLVLKKTKEKEFQIFPKEARILIKKGGKIIRRSERLGNMHATYIKATGVNGKEIITLTSKPFSLN